MNAQERRRRDQETWRRWLEQADLEFPSGEGQLRYPTAELASRGETGSNGHNGNGNGKGQDGDHNDGGDGEHEAAPVSAQQ